MNIVVLITLIACVIYLTYGQNHQNNKISYTIIISLLFLCVLYLCGNIYEKYKELITYGIVFLVLLFCVIYVYSPKVEGMTSEEALKNVASIYNSDNMVVKNLKVTGDLEVLGKSKIPNVDVSGNLVANTLSVNGTSNIKACNMTGDLNVTGKINASDNIKTNQKLYVRNWEMNTGDNHLRMYYNGDQKFVVHSNNTGAWEKSVGYMTNFVRYGDYLFVNNVNGKGNLSARAGGGAGTSENRLGDEIWKLDRK